MKREIIEKLEYGDWLGIDHFSHRCSCLSDKGVEFCYIVFNDREEQVVYVRYYNKDHVFKYSQLESSDAVFLENRKKFSS